MEYEKVYIRNPPLELKRHQYICNEVSNILKKVYWTKDSEFQNDIWIVASNCFGGKYSREIFSSTTSHSIPDQLRKGEKKHQIDECKEQDSDYDSLDADQHDENKLRRILKGYTCLVCVVVPEQQRNDIVLNEKDSHLLQVIRNVSADKKLKGGIIGYVDCQNVKPDSLEQGNLFKDFAGKAICFTKEECLQSVSQVLEHLVVERMQKVKTSSYEDDFGIGLEPEIASSKVVQKLDQLIEICSLPQLPQDVPKGLSDFLLSPEYKDVQGFGIMHNKLKVLIRTDDEDLRKRIFNEATKYYNSKAVEIAIISGNFTCKTHVQHGSGDKLKKESSQSGTIAFCGTMETNRGDTKTVIVTGSHVLRLHEEVFMETDTGRVEVGCCIFSPNEGAHNKPSLVDIAVVEVKPEMEHLFHPRVFDWCKRETDLSISGKICSQYTPVWKHGASSNMTEGFVTAPDFVFIYGNETRRLTLIEGASGAFSLPGDSGACVLFQEDDSIKGLSVVTGEGGMINKHPPDPYDKPVCSTALLKRAIERFEVEYDAKLKIQYS